MPKDASDSRNAHWKTIITSWRPDLQHGSARYAELRLYLVVTPPMPLFDRHLILQKGLRDPEITGTDEGIATTHTWAIPGGAHEHGVLAGPLDGVNRFLALATTLGSCLPPGMRPQKPFHALGGPKGARYTGGVAGDLAGNTAGHWVAYVFERLRETNAIVATTFAGMTAARTRPDPFLASVAAIDLALGAATHQDEEWLPATKAVVRANQRGHDITLTWLTRDAHKHGVRIRPRQLPGNHKKEVEWASLAAYLLRQPRSEEASDEQLLSGRIREAHEHKRKQLYRD